MNLNSCLQEVDPSRNAKTNEVGIETGGDSQDGQDASQCPHSRLSPLPDRHINTDISLPTNPGPTSAEGSTSNPAVNVQRPSKKQKKRHDPKASLVII